VRKLIVLGALVCGTTLAFAAAAAPYVPASDDQVIERLPEKSDPSLRELKKLRMTLKQDPGDLAAAVKLAKRAVEAARETGDPRFLGQAQSALMPWWALADPPAPALLLRATVKQSNHDFDGALADLDRLIGQHPANGQALLTRATVLTVLGNYTAALADCGRIARLTVPLVVAGCMASPQSLSGEAARAYDALTASLASAENADPALREWALTLAAEIADRRGDFAAADEHYRSALALDPRDPYLIAAYCDYLLDRGRPAEVASLIGGQTRNDNLLLRLALAEARMPDAKAAFDAHRQDLADRFEAARQRGDALHRREEARFRLSIEQDANSALRLARENWRVQREPADLRVLLEAATAAGDAATLREMATWTASHRLEYVALAATGKAR
jgi:tetratricopeptide (TPR) repeat protein